MYNLFIHLDYNSSARTLKILTTSLKEIKVWNINFNIHFIKTYKLLYC